jgi:hypothetical protein
MPFEMVRAEMGSVAIAAGVATTVEDPEEVA